MRKWTKASGLIFLAAASVYCGEVIGAAPANKGKTANTAKNTDVKLLEDQQDPFATGAGPTTNPSGGSSTQPTTNAATPSGGGAVLPAMSSNADGSFSLNITNGADLVETLRVIGFQAQKSVIPSKEVRAVLPALDLYNVTVHEALEAILRVNGYVYKEEGNFIYVYTAKEAAEMEKANRVANTEVFRLFYTPAANAATMIKPVLSSDGQVALTTAATSGLDSGTKGTGGNDHATEDMLVITDYPENLDRVRAILKEIDRRPQQILIEATILRASLNENNQLGVDFNVLSGVDFASLTSQNGQIINANLGSGSLAGGQNISSVGTGNNFTSPIAGGLKVGFLNDNVSVFVAALEGITDTTILANPKVLALNKQKGEVIIGRKDGYLTTTVTESSTVQTVDFLDTGTRLIFRPYIGDDGYVRMEVHPEDSSGGLNPQNLPFKNTTEVTSNVMIKDGHTIVIGGLFRDSSTTSRSQIPGLGNIPFAGILFRNQSDQTVREEVIILLTPHIIKDDAAYSAASEEMLKTAEQMRVGVRKGMMWWGRERLAESCYETAVREMNKSNPNRSRALWHLDCATNLNPAFAEAIQMKEELSGKTVMSAENSTIRGFVRRQVMAERRARAATMPTGDLDLSSADSVSSAATTQPSDGATTQPTQPSLADLADLQAMVPATQPVSGSESVSIDDEMGGGLPTTNPSDEEFQFTPVDPASQPSSQPSTQPSSWLNQNLPSNVTELPSEPVNVNSGGNWSGDNK
jgi:type IV pilus assembly protein PilQ